MASVPPIGTTSAPGLASPGHAIPFGEALRTWARVAALSFGGPAGQIAVMHRILVEEKHWIGETRFLHALNYCMLLPGLIALGVLSYLYATFGNIGFVGALFFGLKAAVLALVIEAVIRVGKRALK